MTICIVTDSSCDLPATILQEERITVVPLHIHVGEKSYLDNVELSREEFYSKLPSYKPSPTTASPAPETFVSIFKRLAAEGATQILSIHISKALSGTYNAAQLAVREFTHIPVTVVDSRQLSLGFGFVVWTAARLAKAGYSAAEILEKLESQIRRTYTFATLDTLEYLRRSGRMNGFMAGLGSLLNIKPVLKMHDGKPSSEMTRTWKNAVQTVARLVHELGPLEQASFIHSNALEKAQSLYEQVKDLIPQKEVFFTNINPVLGAHVGPGGIGIACIQAE
jgi:DegV family protein with EDD domain